MRWLPTESPTPLGVTPVAVYLGFPITKLTWSFLRSGTRAGVLRPMLLAEVRARRG